MQSYKTFKSDNESVAYFIWFGDAVHIVNYDLFIMRCLRLQWWLDIAVLIVVTAACCRLVASLAETSEQRASARARVQMSAYVLPCDDRLALVFARWRSWHGWQWLWWHFFSVDGGDVTGVRIDRVHFVCVFRCCSSWELSKFSQLARLAFSSSYFRVGDWACCDLLHSMWCICAYI